MRDRLLYESEPAVPKRSAAAARRTKGGSRGGTPGPASGHRHSLARTAITRIVVLGVVVVGGSAVVIWLRDLAAAFGVNWAGG